MAAQIRVYWAGFRTSVPSAPTDARIRVYYAGLRAPADPAEIRVYYAAMRTPSPVLAQIRVYYAAMRLTNSLPAAAQVRDGGNWDHTSWQHRQGGVWQTVVA